MTTAPDRSPVEPFPSGSAPGDRSAPFREAVHLSSILIGKGTSMIDAGREGDRNVVVRGQDRADCTVMLVEQADGSWLIEGMGLPSIRLTSEVMRIVAEHVLRDRVGTDVGNGEPHRDTLIPRETR